MHHSSDNTINFFDLTRDHYENFPVASFLIPKKYRKDIAIIYWFARTADDIADEGIFSADERLEKLEKFEKEFVISLNSKSDHLRFNLLSAIIKKNKLSANYFIELLSAFKQDVTKLRYESYQEVLEYCKRSANPVGRLLLELFKIQDAEAVKCSDKICTALQLTNFYQDTIIDYKKGRIYYPQNEMKMFSVTEKMFELKENNPNIKALVKYNIDRTQQLFDEGREIINYLSGRFKYEIIWTISGGEKILSKIRKNDFNVFDNRPVLNKSDFLKLLIKSLFNDRFSERNI
ncbi:MAG: squalene synthase HpnC [Ignavibacteriaceae bacterium]|jgi:squalene synthase HpnC|nr:squalene synthase HpnC [Ignavibacteriaceae bacterium]